MNDKESKSLGVVHFCGECGELEYADKPHHHPPRNRGEVKPFEKPAGEQVAKCPCGEDNPSLGHLTTCQQAPLKYRTCLTCGVLWAEHPYACEPVGKQMARDSEIQAEMCARKLFLLMNGFDIESCVAVKSVEKLKLMFCLASDIIDRLTKELRESEDLRSQIKRSEEQIKLPRLCPHGGEHKWVSECSDCGMKILYNPDATIGSKAGKKIED